MSPPMRSAGIRSSRRFFSRTPVEMGLAPDGDAPGGYEPLPLTGSITTSTRLRFFRFTALIRAPTAQASLGY